MRFGFEFWKKPSPASWLLRPGLPVGASLLAIACIIVAFQSSGRRHKMEAEQLNAISNKIQDLRTRNVELRRYL
jgi:hypothetical protein